MEEIEKQASVNKENLPNVTLLKAWQFFELFIIIAISSWLYIAYAFSGSKEMGTILSVLWKVFFLKIIILIFFFMKKRWAVIFNIVQNSFLFLFFIFAFFYTIFKGDKGHISALIALSLIIIVFGTIYFFVVKKHLQYFVYLKKN